MPDMSSIFASIQQPPPVPGDWRRDIPSRAVVASGAEGCVVLWHCGPHIHQQIIEVGNNEEIFNEDPPHGITVFDGWLVGGRAQYTQDGTDYEDSYLSGDFRQPTEDEWLAIREGRCPWDPEEWRVPGAPMEAP